MNNYSIDDRSPKIKSILKQFPKSLIIISTIVIIMNLTILVAIYLFKENSME